MRALVVRDVHRGPSGRADHVARPYSCLGTAYGSGTVTDHALSGGPSHSSVTGHSSRPAPPASTAVAAGRAVLFPPFSSDFARCRSLP